MKQVLYYISHRTVDKHANKLYGLNLLTINQFLSFEYEYVITVFLDTARKQHFHL
jgi:hypothetical protein